MTSNQVTVSKRSAVAGGIGVGVLVLVVIFLTKNYYYHRQAAERELEGIISVEKNKLVN
jgi:hypothetical protein